MFLPGHRDEWCFSGIFPVKPGWLGGMALSQLDVASGVGKLDTERRTAQERTRSDKTEQGRIRPNKSTGRGRSTSASIADGGGISL